MSVTIAQRAKSHNGQPRDLLLVGQRLMDEDRLNVVKNLRAKGPPRQLPIIALVEHGDAPAFPEKSKLAYALFNQKTSETMKRFDPNGKAQPGAAAQGAFASDKVSLRLAFFQAGADECMSLNWDVAECVSRIKAVLRRTQTNVSQEILQMGEIELNLTSYTLHVSGTKVPLTSKVLDFLYVFLSSPNRVPSPRTSSSASGLQLFRLAAHRGRARQAPARETGQGRSAHHDDPLRGLQARSPRHGNEEMT